MLCLCCITFLMMIQIFLLGAKIVIFSDLMRKKECRSALSCYYQGVWSTESWGFRHGQRAISSHFFCENRQNTPFCSQISCWRPARTIGFLELKIMYVKIEIGLRRGDAVSVLARCNYVVAPLILRGKKAANSSFR